MGAVAKGKGLVEIIFEYLILPSQIEKWEASLLPFTGWLNTGLN